jgi:hypothetical protein
MPNMNFEDIPTSWYMNGAGKVIRIPNEFKYVSEDEPNTTYKAVYVGNDLYEVNYSGIKIAHSIGTVKRTLEDGIWKMLSDPKHSIYCSGNEDIINKPSHYHKNEIDVNGYLEKHFPLEGSYTVAEGFYIGNVIKYTSRYKDKNGLQDLEKAKFNLNKLIELEESK